MYNMPESENIDINKSYSPLISVNDNSFDKSESLNGQNNELFESNYDNYYLYKFDSHCQSEKSDLNNLANEGEINSNS